MKYPELAAAGTVTALLALSMLAFVRPVAEVKEKGASASASAAPAQTTAVETSAPATPPADSTAGHVGTINTAPEGDVPASAAIASNEQPHATPASSESNVASITGSVPANMPEGALGDMVKLGQEIVASTDTHPASKEYVGNKMSCSSCHLKDGQDPRGGTFIGLASAYPAFAPREKKVITVEDRIANCYMRSMNGTRPPIDSEAVSAIAAYITWLSEGVPMKMNAKASLGPNAVKQIKLAPESANPKKGKTVFAKNCASCHGADGQGNENIAPLWGDQSYNSGAGMAQNPRLASWVKVSMPLGNPHLSDQDALDVAAFVNSHERPEFVLAEHLGKK